jgi:lactate permease
MISGLTARWPQTKADWKEIADVMFQQTLNPSGNLWLTVLIAMIPFAALLCMLAALRLTAWLATILGGVLTILLGVFVWHAPLGDTLKSYIYGGFTGFWAIDWITFWGLIIFNTLVLTGRFDRFKKWMIHHATADIRIQTIMLAWAFGALLEGLVGFGYPWAVVVPILVGLGIADLDAIRVAALANNAPVSYGALGAPILGLAAVTGLPMMALSGSVGSIVAVLALLPPWVLIYLVSGWEGMIEAWPLAIVGSLSYIAGQWPVARYLGPYLPDLSGAIVSFWILFLLVKLWRPKTIRGFGGIVMAPATGHAPALASAKSSLASNPTDLTLGSASEALSVWFPYIVLIAVVVSWTGPWSHLPAVSWFRWSVSANSSVTQKPILSVFNFTPFAGGTSILVSWLVLLLILRPPLRIIGQVFFKTFKQMWGALLVAFLILALA